MRIVALVLFLLAAWGPGAAMGAELRLRPVGAGFGLSSDGERFAAWDAPGGGATHVVDGRTGSVRTVSWPERCAGLAAIGGGQLMWRCEDVERRTEAGLYDLTDGRLSRITIPARLRQGEDPDNRTRLYRVGRASIAGQMPFTGAPKEIPRWFYLNWRTGAYRTQREASEFERLPRRDRYADLNADGLVRPLCRAARERRDDGSALLQVVGRRALKSVSPGLRVDTCGGRRIKLTRCGEDPGDYDCGTPQLGSRWAVWTEAGRARAYDLRRRRRLATRRLRRTEDDLHAAHVRGALFVEAAGRIFRAKLPR